MALFSPQIDLTMYKRHLVWMIMLMTGALAILIVRLYYLQMSESEKYVSLSQNNFIAQRREVALRGMIYDRTGELLADNRPSYNLYFTPAFCIKDAFDVTLARLTEYIGLTDEEITRIREQYLNTKRLDRFVPFLVRRNMVWSELALVEQNANLLDGVEVRSETQRVYPRETLAAHLLGYVGEISPGKLKSYKKNGYLQGDVIGKTGVEREWETELHGKNGLINVLVDARGQRVSESEVRQIIERGRVVVPVVHVYNLILSVDVRLQEYAEARFPGDEGAIVALDPQTGFILAMVSRPAFDPNLMSSRMSPRLWKELVKEVDRPLTNRVTQQHYPPGSAFKPFTGLAALESGRYDENTSEICTGSMSFGNYTFRCCLSRGHGSISIHRAIVQSCDVFFYKVGLNIGLDAIANTARSFGFGSLTGFDCSREIAGIIPDEQWYNDHTATGFLPGFTISNSIGQGAVNVTPLQLAVAFAAIANSGTLYQPQVVQQVLNFRGEVVRTMSPIVREKVKVSHHNLEIIQQALAGVCNEPGGTAYSRRPRNVDFQVAGKTGTAQVVSQGSDKGKGLPYDFRDHGWFVGYAPVTLPKILVVVLHEHGGFGALAAAPLVMELITYYLERLNGGARTMDK